MLTTNRETIVGIVVPCFNEEEVLPETISRLTNLLEEMISEQQVSRQSAIWFVDDGSKDTTWSIIEGSKNSNPFIRGIKLSRNKGHQNALIAGLETASGHVLVSIDADLQDDTNVIKEMVSNFHDGDDIVYGVRSSRKSDSFFKRFTAESYYKILAKMGVNIVYNHADFRLLSRRALEALKEYQEVNIFIRGIIPELGFSSSIVEYERSERFLGESKYPLKKMLALAFDGITSFSAVPLRFIAFLGFLIFAGSITVSSWILFVRFFTDNAIPGWASSVLPIYFIGGIQLLSIGIVGEYLAKTYMETKQRPRYFISKLLDNPIDPEELIINEKNNEYLVVDSKKV
jgi:glycosyltransferase involved in cell wall biosynthesis